MRFWNSLFTVAPLIFGLLASGSSFGQEFPAQPGQMIVQPDRLNLRTGDVVTSQRPNLLDVARIEFDPHRRYVLQLEGPITPELRAEIQAAGAILGDYLPSYAYIVDLGGANVAELRGMNFVRWVGEYENAWKIDPGIGEHDHEFVTPLRREIQKEGRVVVEISLFEGFELDPALEAITAIPDVMVFQGKIDLLGGNYVIPIAVPLENVPLIAEIDAVQFVEEAAEFVERRNNSARWIVQTNAFNNTVFYNNNLRGEGQIVGILDSRIDPNHCSFVDPDNPIGPNHRKIHAYNATLGADFHGTHVAGTAVGDAFSNANTRGVAYLSRLVYNTIPFLSQSSVQNRHQTHHNQGARVHSNSWGSNQHITTYHGASRAIDLFMRSNEESLVVHAVANSSNPGPTISIPENAKNLIAVGASGKNTTNPNQTGVCTAKPGPTSDGRYKPEVFAPGCNTVSASPGGCSTGGSSGTSMATPAVSGLALLVRQYFTDGYYPTGAPNPSNGFTPSAALVKATVLNSAQRMTHTNAGSGYPNFVQGWGRVLGNAAVHFQGQQRMMIAEEVRNNVGLSTGQIIDYPFEVTGSSENLRVTLAFTDVAGTAGTSFPVVNDLDLEVIAPNGTLYKGNVFSGNFSAPGGSKDSVNNVEQVHIASPQQGEWIARVRAAAVNSGPLQGFGLVITGQVLGGDVVPPPPPPPSNDTCQSSIAIGLVQTPFSTINASTTGFDEPGHCDFNGYTHIENDVWFRHTSQCTGLLTISLCGADFNTKMAIYGQSCPQSAGQPLACNDNFCAQASQISLAVNEGQIIRIRIGGFQGDTGTGTLVLACGDLPPENNTCDDALIVKDPFTEFTTDEATTDGPDESGTCDFGGGSSVIENDVWFLVQAECTGDLLLSVCDADFDARMAVYEGDCPTSPGEAIACDHDGCAPGPEVSVPVEKDEFYIVRVGSSSGQTGSGTLGVVCVPEPEPACPGDLTGDGVVNVFDLLDLLGAWGPCADCGDCLGDLTGDCAVNVFDLLELLAAWGPCPE